MKIGEVFRYPRLRDARAAFDKSGKIPASVDGLPNFFHVTASPTDSLTTLERGIAPILRVKTPDGVRTPAILIRSSPHKAGSETTPWQDKFVPDMGYAYYFGDAKIGQDKPPEHVFGNKALLEQFKIHTSTESELRRHSAPMLLFIGVPHSGRQKGQVMFQGLGVLTSASIVVQRDQKTKSSFANYRFGFSILDISNENEQFDWDWINARRDSTKSLKDTLKLAPYSWRRWISDGNDSLPSVRRRVAKLNVVKKEDQLPAAGSKLNRILNDIYHFYDKRKHRFEALAERVTEFIVNESGADFRTGWITQPSSDGGADFVGLIRIGTDFARTKMVVLGQAKCVVPTSATGGLHLARVVARLKRGWLGAFVTTGYFSEAAQREVIEDKYPIMLISGRQLADTVSQMMHKRGNKSVESFLKAIDKTYDERVANRDPEDILNDY